MIRVGGILLLVLGACAPSPSRSPSATAPEVVAAGADAGSVEPILDAGPDAVAELRARMAVVIAACEWRSHGYSREAEICRESHDFARHEPADDPAALHALLSAPTEQERFLAAWRLGPASAAAIGAAALLDLAEAEPSPAVAAELVAELGWLPVEPAHVDRLVALAHADKVGYGAIGLVRAVVLVASREATGEAQRRAARDLLARIASGTSKARLEAIDGVSCEVAKGFLSADDEVFVAAVARILRQEHAPDCAAEAGPALALARKRGAWRVRELALVASATELGCLIQQSAPHMDHPASPHTLELARWLLAELRTELRRRKSLGEIERMRLESHVDGLERALQTCSTQP